MVESNIVYKYSSFHTRESPIIRVKCEMNNQNKIHIFGASGSGVTTLGISLAQRLGVPHLDSDDFFWIQTDIPYTVKREPEKRVELLNEKFAKTNDWVLSGSLCEWGDFAIPLFTLAIFILIPTELRVARLKERELKIFGQEALSPGGWFHENHHEFIEWASLYDTAGMETRSRKLHEEWMKELPCDLIRFEYPMSTREMTDEIMKRIN